MSQKEQEILNLLEALKNEVESNKVEIEKLKIENKKKDIKIQNLERQLDSEHKDIHKLTEKTVEVIEHFEHKCHILKDVVNVKIGDLEILKKESKELDFKCRALARRFLDLFDDSELKIGKQNEKIDKLRGANAVVNKNFEYIEKDLVGIKNQMKNMKIFIEKAMSSKDKSQ